MNDLEKLMKKIEADPQNARRYTKEGHSTFIFCATKAKILIVGQAPGIKAQRESLVLE